MRSSPVFDRDRDSQRIRVKLSASPVNVTETVRVSGPGPGAAWMNIIRRMMMPVMTTVTPGRPRASSLAS
jgi:hypothetical protein